MSNQPERKCGLCGHLKSLDFEGVCKAIPSPVQWTKEPVPNPVECGHHCVFPPDPVPDYGSGQSKADAQSPRPRWHIGGTTSDRTWIFNAAGEEEGILLGEGHHDRARLIVAAVNSYQSGPREQGNQKSDSGLLPCPFCGGSKIVRYDDDGLFWKRCTSCGATGPETTKYSGEEGDPFVGWNTRAGSQPVPAGQDEVEKALALFKEVHDTVVYLGGSVIDIAVDSDLAKKLLSAASSQPAEAMQKCKEKQDA